MNVKRRLFPIQADVLRRFLLAQDGSTTRICEALNRGPVQVIVHRQVRTQDVPDEVRTALGGTQWLERVTSLCAESEVLMDNLSFTRLDAVPEWFLAALDEGQAPIGHLLDKLFVRREFRQIQASVADKLWEVVALPDDRASRAYRILTPENPLMYIFEVFRGGLALSKDAVQWA